MHRFCFAVLVAIVLFSAACGGGGGSTSTPTNNNPQPTPVQASPALGQLAARPGTPTKTCTAGEQALGLGTDRDGLLLIPSKGEGAARQLVVLLHGSGGSRSIADLLRDQAQQRGFILLVPESRGRTWDLALGGFGPDVQFIDSALKAVFERCAIDGAHIAIAGFSDGASDALSMGLTNGTLFTHAIGYSPGFFTPGPLSGKPSVFVSHGTRDTILPIDKTSRVIVPNLRGQGYVVTFQEFDGTHEVPLSIRDQSMDWFLGT